MAENFIRGQRNFASGEISPLLHARATLNAFATGLAECENFVVLPQGALTRTPGTEYIADAQSASRLIEFQFNEEQGYVLELFNVKTRFYTPAGQVMSGMSAYELTTPWDSTQIHEIDYTQSADILYVTHADLAERQLQRLADNNWNVVTSVYSGGPFLPQNLNESIVLYTTTAPAGAPDYGFVKGASITLKADGGSVFTADMVGALFKLAEQPLHGSTIGTWEDRDYAKGKKVRVGDNFYVLVDKTSGTFQGDANREPPTHTEGELWTGTDSSGTPQQLWRYMHSGFGIVKITVYTSATQVTAEVVSAYLPDSVDWDETGTAGVDGGTWRWSEGAWSDERGYPAHTIFHEQRKWLARTPAQIQKVWGSVTDDFLNMEAGTADDQAVSYELASREVNGIRWLHAGDRLHLGTQGAEWAFSATDVREPITPTNVLALSGSATGSKKLRPLDIDGPVFVSKRGRRLHKLTYSFERARLVSQDLSLLAEHIAKAGIEDMAWQEEPYRVIWLALTDGSLAGVTYREDQNVLAWHRHPMTNGKVKSLAVMSNGDSEEVWMIVERVIDSSTVRYIERLKKFFEDETDPVEDGWFLDCAMKYEGTATTTLTGLDHLEGETVHVLADGKFMGAKVVTSGQVTVSESVTKAIIGLPKTSRFKTLPFDQDAQGGAMASRAKRVPAVAVSLKDSVGGEVRAPSTDDPDPDWQSLQDLAGLTMGQAPPAQTGIVETETAGMWGTGGQVELRQAAPFPMTVLGLFPVTQV